MIILMFGKIGTVLIRVSPSADGRDEFHGDCPICLRRGTFTLHPGNLFYEDWFECSACGEFGDAFDYLRLSKGSRDQPYLRQLMRKFHCDRAKIAAAIEADNQGRSDLAFQSFSPWPLFPSNTHHGSSRPRSRR